MTGKLSDAAGLVALPPLLALLTTVLMPQITTTTAAAVTGLVASGLAFTLVKAIPAGVGPAEPLTANRDKLTTELVLALLAGLLAVGMAGWRPARRWDGFAVGFLGTLGIGAIFGLLGAAGFRTNDIIGLCSLFLALAGVALAAVGAIGVLVTAARHTLRVRYVALFPIIGVLTTTGVAVPFLAWWEASIGYRSAALTATAAALTGVTLAGWLGYRLERQPAGPADESPNPRQFASGPPP